MHPCLFSSEQKVNITVYRIYFYPLLIGKHGLILESVHTKTSFLNSSLMNMTISARWISSYRWKHFHRRPTQVGSQSHGRHSRRIALSWSWVQVPSSLENDENTPYWRREDKFYVAFLGTEQEGKISSLKVLISIWVRPLHIEHQHFICISESSFKIWGPQSGGYQGFFFSSEYVPAIVGMYRTALNIAVMGVKKKK
jgi:hypothetical protein